MRRSETDNTSWPETPAIEERARTLRNSTATKLGELLPNLRVARHDERLPDLYGQVHQLINQEAFDDILMSRYDAALSLFQAVLGEVDAARVRLVSDLRDRDPQVQFRYSAEPVLGAMELSGYALLMQEADGEGIWEQVKELWTTLLDGPSRDKWVGVLLGASLAQDPMLGMSAGALTRMGRSQRFRQDLRSRGIVPIEDDFDPFQQAPSKNSARLSPLLELFLRDYGFQDNAADYFVAEFLVGQLKPNEVVSDRVERLLASIKRKRQRRDPDSGEVN